MRRDKRITLRTTEEEKQKIKDVMAVYGMDMDNEMSDFFRAVISYIDDKRPVLAVKISPKGKGE